MAKGDSHAYSPQLILSEEPHEIVAWASREFERIAGAFSYQADGRMDVDHVEPDRVRDGTMRYADGVHWNPGAGAGPYIFINGVWVPMAQGVITGSLLDYGGTSTPNGYLLCDGSNVSRTTYAALFTAIGTTWGIGDGSTTFTLPDLRRRVTVGKSGSGTATLGNAVGNTGGEEAHALTIAELAAHTHSFSATTSSDGSHTHSESGHFPYGVNSGPDLANAEQTATTGAAGAHTHTVSGTSGSQGSGTAHNVIQPSAVVTKVIKT